MCSKDMTEKFFKANAIGIDEVGRGAIAGPVVAAAVLIDESQVVSVGIDDSKALSEKKREVVNQKLLDMANNGLLLYGIGVVDQKEIDQN